MVIYKKMENEMVEVLAFNYGYFNIIEDKNSSKNKVIKYGYKLRWKV